MVAFKNETQLRMYTTIPQLNQITYYTIDLFGEHVGNTYFCCEAV